MRLLLNDLIIYCRARSTNLLFILNLTDFFNDICSEGVSLFLIQLLIQTLLVVKYVP